ncbi:MAG: EAL domain-containing protein [Cellvibrionaceae bacterium]|nr:EAL domain-containing protein [Cellvibrionaceae bacterium]
MITYFGQQNLEQTFLNERDRILKDRQRSINTALESIQIQLLHLAGHLQGLASQGDPQQSLRKRLEQVAVQNWDLLNFEWEVDALLLYGSEREPWLQLGMPAIAKLLPPQWLDDVYQAESPVSRIMCRNSCWQIVATPVLIDSQQNGVMILVKSLVDAVIEFQTSTAADVGILIPSSSLNELVETRLLPNWQRHIVALTGGPKAFEALQQLSQQHEFSALNQSRVIDNVNKRSLESALILLDSPGLETQASVVILEDVSAELNNLNSTIRTLIIAALIILISAEMALLWILWRPMNQLRQVAAILPELARNRGDRLSLLPRIEYKPKALRNEIHKLHESSIILAEKLAELDQQVQERTQGLKIRSRELLTQRNFANTLINNVQAIILTQDKQGQIQLLNNETSSLLGMSPQIQRQPPGINFFDCFQSDNNERLQQDFLDLVDGNRLELHYEQEVLLGNKLHYIQWQHNLLPDKSKMILSVGVDLTARKAAEDNLAWLADHDHLTKLYNRRHFQREFKQILARCQRNQREGALFFFDIDQFKLINDTSGHPAGDALLCEVASRLSMGVRNIDVFSRLGGDEFALITEEISDDGILAMAQKLCDIVADIEVRLNDVRHKISISIGIVEFPRHGLDIDDLMANVDLAMYKAKARNNGRSNWEIFSADTSTKGELVKTVDWRARIQQALDKQAFILHYQPIYNIKANTISHHEALVRMLDEQGNILPPSDFIPVAEQTGLILELDQYVVRQAIKDLRRFLHAGEDLNIAVNISAKSLANTEFIAYLKQCIKDNPELNGRFIFELTETAAVEDIKTSADIISSCKGFGYQFSIDDFGIGYSSWFYLREFPVDFVKIDGAFVRNLANSKEDYLFVKAINDVAQGLGKKTIAEFVEDQASLELIAKLGVDYAQGYHIGKPSPAIKTEISSGAGSQFEHPRQGDTLLQ